MVTEIVGAAIALPGARIAAAIAHATAMGRARRTHSMQRGRRQNVMRPERIARNSSSVQMPGS